MKRLGFLTILLATMVLISSESQLFAKIKAQKEVQGDKTSWKITNDAFYDENANTLYLVGNVTFRSLVRELDYSSDKGKVVDIKSQKIRPCLIEVLRTNVKYKEFDKVPCQAVEGLVCVKEKNALNIIVTSPENKSFLANIALKISERRGVKIERVTQDSLTRVQKTLDCSTFER